MRVSASLGAIVATGLLGHTSAQAADYGSTGGNPNGFPSDITGNIPPTSSNGSPGTFPPGTAPGGAPGGVPPIGPVIPTGGIPGSMPPVVPFSSIAGDGSVIFPSGLPYPGNGPPNAPSVGPGGPFPPGGFPTFVTSSGPPTDIPGDGSVIVPGSVPNPGGVPGGPGGHGAPGASNPVYPTCATSTTTIVVTVYATNSNDSPDGSTDGSSGGFPNDSPNSPSDGSDPHQTVAQPPAPTEPPSFTINSANLPVAPFTTLTIDIWGPGDDDNGSEDDDGTGPVDGADPSDGAGTGNDDTGNGDDNAPTDGSNPTDGGFPGDGSIPGDGSVPGEDPNSPTFSSTTAPDTAPEYSSDESGVFPTAAPGDVSGGLPGDSVSSQAPASFPSQAPSSGNPGDAPGVPPFNPSVDSGAHLSDSLPVSTRIISQAPAEVSPWLTWGPATVGNAPLPTSWVTITGADGLPTVVNGGSGVSGVTITGTDGIPTIISGDNGVPGATITGADGLPTIIDGGSVVPAVTITGIDGLPTVISGGNGVPVVTITGADGIPTVISGGNIPGDQGWPPFVSSDASPASGGPGLPQGLPTSLPFPPPAGVTAGPGGAVPGGPSDGSGSSFPGDDSANGITTCTQVTVIGSDGLPTVIDSTWVIPASAVATQASAQLPAPGITQGPGGIPATGTPAGPDGSFYITSTTYTVIGSDGLPTVVQSTWVVPDPTQVVSIQTQAPFPGIPSSDPNGLPGGISGIPGGIATGPGQQGGGAPITTCTSYTVIGTDGLPTVVESTWLVPGPVNTLVPFPGSPTNPSGASSALPNGIPPVITDFPPSDGSAGPGVTRGAGITTCTSYTAIGADGLPTVIDSTWVIPGAANTQGPLSGNPSYVSNPSPPGFPTGVPGKITASPELPYPGDGSARGVATCASYTIIGADGLPTVVESTWVVPDESALPTATGADFPQITVTNSPQSFTSDAAAGQFTVVTTATVVGTDGQPTPVVQTVVLTSAPTSPQSSTSDAAAGQFTVVTTEIVVGTDGQPTPVVQTVVLTSASDLGVPHGTVSGLPAPPPSGPVISSGDLHPLPTGLPALSDYGAASGFPSVVGSSDDAQATFISGTVTGTLTYTTTQVVDSTGEPIFSDGAQDPLGTGVPVPDVGYGPVPSEITLWPQASNVQTSIWTNLIEEPTTTYTIKFPLTTMATITVPAGSSVGKRVLRRQDSSEPSFPTWSNSSSAATSLTESTSLLASFSALTTGDALPAPSVTSSAASGAPTMCSTGGIIGNTTIDFDNSMPGPLFNPLEAIWFSEGFHIVPPSLQPVQPYVPTSGGQVVEFVPPSLSNTTSSGSSDVAEVGMGPHSPSPCFRFDFFGASLGCETQGNEEWCEFEISAYRYNDTSASEESIAWSEIKQVPACSTFLEGGYQLTPIELEGYKDLSSVLITLRVGLELRTWWADDFRVGWTDNSCVAEACRSDSPHILAKRETVESVLSRGIWGWTPTGFERLNYTLVPESMN